MSALANTIRMLSGRLALFRAERERYQALCAAAYQLAGAMNAPVRFLDALSDGANGEIEARQKTEDLTPVDSKEIGAFPAESDEEVRTLREDLQATKLLAHANAEMFKAERAENEALKHDLDSYMRISKEYLEEIEVWRDEAVAHQAFVDAFNASPNHDTDEEEQAHGQWEAAIEAAAPYKKAAIDAARDSKSNTTP